MVNMGSGVARATETPNFQPATAKRGAFRPKIGPKSGTYCIIDSKISDVTVHSSMAS